MGTKVNSNYEDLISFVRASGGGRATALRPVSYGTELVDSGTFDDASALDDWTATNANLSINSQRLEVENSGSSQGRASQSITTEIGKIYKASFDVVKVSGEGNPIVRLGVSNAGAEYYSAAHSSDATVSFIFTPTTTTTFWTLFTGSSTSGFSAIFDNISVKEVTFDQPDGTLTLFEHPENVPRVEYDADGNRLGLLVEEARTNLLTQSNEFTAATGDVTKNGTGLDGQVSAWTLENPDANAARVDLSVTVSTSTTYTASVFAKQGTTNFIYLSAVLFTTPANGNVWFDLDAGTVGTESSGITGTISHITDGWYRCSITFTTDTVDTSGVIRINVSKGNGQTTADAGDNVLIYGAQVEAGSFPTSYIKTTGSTATRSADVASIPVADFGFNQGIGSLVVDANPIPAGGGYGNKTIVDINNGGVTSQISLLNDNSDRLLLIFDPEATTNDVNIGVAGAEGNNLYACGWELNSVNAAHGGILGVEDNANIPIKNATQVTISSDANGNAKFSGHIKSIKYYPRRLTNAQLQDITS